MNKTKKVAFCACLATVAIVFGYIESMISIPFAIPGIKPGFGNIVVLICLYCISKRAAFSVMLIKVLVSNMLFATPVMLIYSLAGGVLSFFVMATLKKLDFGILGVSVGGGIFHNLGQLTVAFTLLENINVFYYMPILIVSGVVSALITGVVAKMVIRRTDVLF